MLLSVARVGKSLFASFELTFERLLTSVYSGMDLEIFGTSKSLAATRKLAGERLFSGMNTKVIDELVFGFECNTGPRAI